MLNSIDILDVRKKLEAKRAKAKREAELREKRTVIVKVLFKTLPRQEDLKKRTEAIDMAADRIVESLYGQETHT
jgi:hypothetical protein